MSASTTNERLKAWVDEWIGILQPDDVYWCDGSAEEYERLCQALVDGGTFTDSTRRSGPTATGHTAIRAMSRASRTARSSVPPIRPMPGPTNNWREPAEHA